MRHRRATLTLIVVALSTGCASTPPKSASSPVRSSSTQSTPPVTAAELQGLLPSPAEVNAIVGTTGMTVTAEANAMFDDSAEMKDADCRYADGPAMAPVYDGSLFLAMRAAQLQGSAPHDDYVGMAVVAFPTAQRAEAFFTDSAHRWPACANRSYTDTVAGASPKTWTVGPVITTDGALTIVKTEDGVPGWACQRALAVRNNVVVDVIAGNLDGSPSGLPIAQRIAANVP